MKRNRLPALLLCLALLTGLFGCARQEEEKKPAPSPTPAPVKDLEGEIVVGELRQSAARSAVLEEIAAKYMADRPAAGITLRSFDSAEALDQALAAGEIDLVELDQERQLAAVKQELLWDFLDGLNDWEEYISLTSGAKLAAKSLGKGHAYLLPFDFVQDVMYFRTDWFNEYNDAHEPADRVYCRTWSQMPDAAAALGERGRLALAGGEKLDRYFDSFLWSAVTLGRLADAGAGYFTPYEEPVTIFGLESAVDGVEQFLEIMEDAALPDSLNWTREQAVDAFVEGRAGVLLGDRSVCGELEERMEPGSWTVAEYPRGCSGTGVFSPDEFRGWGISALSGEKELSFDYLCFLSNADNNTYYAKTCGTLPIHSEAASLEPSFTQSDMAMDLKTMRETDQYAYALRPEQYAACEGWAERLDGALRRCLNGELSPEELLREMDEYWSAALADEGELWKAPEEEED